MRLTDRQAPWLLAAGALVVFVIDELLPYGFSIGVFYIPLVAAAALWCEARTAIWLAALFLVLMTVELFSGISAPAEVRQLAMVNRALAMAMVTGLALLLIRFRHVRTALSASQERYEALADHAAKALAESEDRFRGFMDNTPAVAFMKDEQGVYVYANRLWQQHFNAAGRPMGSFDDTELFSADLARQFRERDAEVLKTGVTWQGQEAVEYGGQTRHWWVFNFPFTSAAQERFLGGVAFDVTDRIEAADEIRRLNAELEARVERRTEQLAAVNKELEAFTYSVSHDLRAPLRGMSGFARVLEEDYADKLDADGRRYLEIIKSNAAQMGQLIDDLLALSRLGRQPLKEATVALDALAGEAYRQAAADSGGRSIELAIEPLPTTRGDVNLLRQVLVNLLSNAVKFTRHVSPARIQVGSERQNGEVVYYVRDNGAGFDMRYANKLFGVFQRLHGPEDYAGTGVGLAIVKRIIDRHGGRIWAQAEPGKGATFYFTLAAEDAHVG